MAKIKISKQTLYEYKKGWFAMHEWVYDNPEFEKLGGRNRIVEIDEALLGKKHGFQKFGNKTQLMRL